MKRVAAGFGDDVHHPAVVVSILGVEVVGENTELLDGIQVRNDRGSAVHVLLHVDGIHHESVGGFALAVDRNIARIQIAGRIDGSGHAGHDHRSRRQSRHRTDAGLNRQQVRIAAAVQGKRLDLRVLHHFAQMSGDGFDLGLNIGLGSTDRDGFRLLAYFERVIQRYRGVGIDGDIGLLLGLESGCLDGQIVAADREGRKRIETARVGGCLELGFQGDVHQRQLHSRDHGATGVFEHAGQAASCQCPGE